MSGRPTAVPLSPRPSSGLDPAPKILAELQHVLGQVRDVVQGGGAFPWSTLEKIIERAVRSLEAESDLLPLASNPTLPKDVDYLAFHPAQVAVLAVRLGLTLGYDARHLVELGMAASLIGVGLWQLPGSIQRRLDSLSASDAAQYHAHPRLGAELIKRWGPPFDGLAETVLEYHEREQGQGFPAGIEGGAIKTDAKIVGLADTYMTLTAPPSLRPGLRPHEAIREIVRGQKDAFAPALIKALLSEISFFPPGTVVRLNTGETGPVVAVNRNHPLRPKVEVVEGKNGPLRAPKIVDLAEAPFMYIVGPVAETSR